MVNASNRMEWAQGGGRMDGVRAYLEPANYL